MVKPCKHFNIHIPLIQIDDKRLAAKFYIHSLARHIIFALDFSFKHNDCCIDIDHIFPHTKIVRFHSVFHAGATANLRVLLTETHSYSIWSFICMHKCLQYLYIYPKSVLLVNVNTRDFLCVYMFSIAHLSPFHILKMFL